jgi:predicted nucleic acid-binding protein
VRPKNRLPMVGNVLVDSSYFIDRLRRGIDPLVELSRFADRVDFVTCGVVQVEVLRGIKQERVHRRMAETLGSMIYVPTLNHVWERVSRYAWELDRKGKSMQVGDLVIAVCAEESGAAILTLDSDFLRFPGARVLRDLT